MKLYIKNMVCLRCKLAVQQELNKLGIVPIMIELGEVELAKPLTEEQHNDLKSALSGYSFELLEDKQSQVIEKIKSTIVEIVHHSNNPIKHKLSVVLAEKLGYTYNYLSNLFSQVEGVTIEQYFLTQRIERVKELMMYDNHSQEKISDILGFSGASHLGKQFRQLTGVTPKEFKRARAIKRMGIEEL